MLLIIDKKCILNKFLDALKKASIVDESVNLEFVGFGTMNGKDGKPYKTRDGGVLKLEDLINKVVEEARKKEKIFKL